MTSQMTLKLHPTSAGYADERLRKTFEKGVKIEKPFVFLTGPNGSGKSSCLRGIRSTIGLTGERMGQEGEVLGAEGTKYAKEKKEELFFSKNEKPSAVFDLKALGWTGQESYLFDSRAASSVASKSNFEQDMLYHLTLVAGGGSKVSHGEFIAHTLEEALDWACGGPLRFGGKAHTDKNREEIKKSLSKGKPSSERWLFLDEPENGIDIDRLLIVLSVLIYTAKPGKLRVFCSSHSPLFVTGIIDHPKVQTIDFKGHRGEDWVTTQLRAMRFVSDCEKFEKTGKNISENINKIAAEK